ncbi:MAG: hypothetical protein JEZ07_17160 [Phycisphaerae bacterium]|nr:hypothetical protein [Phycisphaerae bacterium]
MKRENYGFINRLKSLLNSSGKVICSACQHAVKDSLHLESLESRQLLSAQLHIDYLNIVKDTLEAGEMYELQYKISNHGDSLNYMYSSLSTKIYQGYSTGMSGSIGGHYIGQIEPGGSTGLKSVWISMFSMPPANLPAGPGSYTVEVSVRGASTDNDPILDHVNITANDNSPPEVDMDSVVMNDIYTENWGQRYTDISFTVKDDIRFFGGYGGDLKIIGPDGNAYNSSDSELIDSSDDNSEKQYTFSILSPSSTGWSSWDPEDNGTYQVYLNQGAFEDAYYRENPETYLGSFTANIEAYPPIAELASPFNSGSIGIEQLQEQSYIDIKYTDTGNWGLKASSITDSADEFYLQYEDGTEIKLKPYTKPELVEGTESTYRYQLKFGTYDPPLKPGVVKIVFAENVFTDEKSTPNEASTLTFSVALPPTAPAAELVYPLPDEDVDLSQLNENSYIDVSFKRTKSSSINGDEISFAGAGGANVEIKGKPTQINENTYRYTIDGSFGAGPVEVEFVEDSFTNEAGDNNITDMDSFVSFPNISPLQTSIDTSAFDWDPVKKQFSYSGEFGLGLQPPEGQDFNPVISADGQISFDGNIIDFAGLISINVLGQEMNLFDGEFQFDVGSLVTSSLNNAAGVIPNKFTVAGTEVNLAKIEFAIPEGKTVADTQLELQGSVKLPDDMGGFELSIVEPHKLIVSPTAGVSISGGKLTLPDLEIFMFGGELKMIAKDMSVEYIAEVTVPEPVPAALRFRGSVSLPYFYNATANFTGDDSYIEVTRLGGVDWYGTLSVEDIIVVPNQWEINNALLGMKKDDKDNYITECEAKMTLPTGIALGGKFHFVNGDINFLELEVDNVNKPLGATGAFLQRIMGHVDHLSEYEQPKQPVSFGGGVGLTAGPEVTVPLPAWLGLGDKFEGVLVGLDLSADIDENHLNGHGYVEIVSGLVQGNANVELDWEHESFSASMDLDALQGLITANASLFVDYSEAFDTTNINAAGKGTVKIPTVIPLWGGVELGSANMKLQYRDDNSNKNDYVMGWGKILVSEYHNYYITGGIKVGFDGSYEFVGGKEIAKLNLPASDMSAGVKLFSSPQNNLYRAITNSVADYTVEPGTGWLLMGADWENSNSNTTVEIIDPQGKVYPENTFDDLDNIFIVDTLTDDQGKSVYVHEPEPGTWSIRFINPEQLTGLQVNSMVQNESSEVEIVSVETDPWDQEAIIDYTSDWSDNDTVINFYYDTDNQNGDGFQFAADIVPTASNSVIWDTDNVPAGVYYVYAETIDSANAPVISYWAQPVIIEEVPSGVEIGIGDDLAKSVTYTDADGTLVTVKLSKGQGTVTIIGENVESIAGKKGVQVNGENLIFAGIDISSGNVKTALTIATKGGSIEGATIGDITGESLGKLTGKQLDLVGNIELTGSLTAMAIDDIYEDVTIITGDGAVKGISIKADEIAENVTFDTAGIIKSLQASSYTGGSIYADSISSIKIKGDFGADITLNGADSKGLALKSLSVAGNINNTNIEALAGAIGSISAGQWENGSLSSTFIKSISTKGNKKSPVVNGNCDIDLVLSGLGAYKAVLGSAKIAGDLKNSNWDIAGDVGALAVKGIAADSTFRVAGDVKAITLGAAIGSDFLIGIDGDVQRYAEGHDDFTAPAAELKSFSIKGIKGSSERFFADTNISAGMIGKVTLVNGDFNIGHSGIFAFDRADSDSEIKSIKYKDSLTKQSWSWPVKGDFLPMIQEEINNLINII